MTYLRIKVDNSLFAVLAELGELLGHTSPTQTNLYLVKKYAQQELNRVKESEKNV